MRLAAAVAVSDMEDECWEYLDPKSVKHGPFSGTRMAVWYEHNMLPEDLGVRHVSTMPFLPIKELFHPPLLPFKSRPRPAQQQCQSMWQYQDTRGQLQGPFTSAQMALWYEHNMLPKGLQLRRTSDAVFATIAEYFPKPLLPFQSMPVMPHLRVPQDGGLGLTAPSMAVAAKPAAQPKQQPAQPQAKGKAGPKAKAQAPEPVAVEQQGKGAGRGAGPIGGGAAAGGRGQRGGKQGPGGKEPRQQQQQQQQVLPAGWNWSEPGWSATEKAWWEWSSWNGWAAENGNCAGWESNGRDKQQCAEWKGAPAEGQPIGASPPKEKAGKGNGAVQAAFGNLRWGPFAQDEDLFPEGTVRKVYDEGIVWEERWISPLAVRFSQGKIHPFFHERGPISEVMLQIKLREDEAGADGSPAWKRIEPPFPPVQLLHLKEQGVLITLDNRRLYALQRFALQEWPTVCLAKALCVDELTPTRLRAENRKFTNRLCGMQLEVESRQNAFDTFSWVTEAAHSEAPRFCRPVAIRAVDKVLSLLPVFVVHTLLSPRMRPLLRSRWPLLQLAAKTLPDPRKREFLSKRLLLHHVLELSRPSRQVHNCPAVCIGYKAETVVTLSKGKSCVKSMLSLAKPISLLPDTQPLSSVQQRVLVALLPLFCLPYARFALRGATREWVTTFLLAWGKVAASSLHLPLGP